MLAVALVELVWPQFSSESSAKTKRRLYQQMHYHTHEHTSHNGCECSAQRSRKHATQHRSNIAVTTVCIRCASLLVVPLLPRWLSCSIAFRSSGITEVALVHATVDTEEISTIARMSSHRSNGIRCVACYVHRSSAFEFEFECTIQRALNAHR